jgi:anti-sigma factor RsiW
MRACFDEGTLQAYLDGELGVARAGEVAAHLSACETCAAFAHEATDHFALLSDALSVGETLSVPTEHLRARLDASIAELQPTRAASPNTSKSFVERLRAFASSLPTQLAFAPRGATAFASLLVAAVLIATIFYVLRPQTRAPQGGQSGAAKIAKVKPPVNEGVEDHKGSSSSAEIKQAANGNEPDVKDSAPRRVLREKVGSAGFNGARYTRVGSERGVLSRAANDDASEAALLPVEKSYASAIASLKSSIDQQKAQSMTPTLRAEYERNLAVVDRAIGASRAAARRDPADKDAQEFLRAAYQDKLELLRTVADQTQIASIGR